MLEHLHRERPHPSLGHGLARGVDGERSSSAGQEQYLAGFIDGHIGVLTQSGAAMGFKIGDDGIDFRSVDIRVGETGWHFHLLKKGHGGCDGGVDTLIGGAILMPKIRSPYCRSFASF